MIIETNRLSLREMSEADYDALYAELADKVLRSFLYTVQIVIVQVL